MGPERVLDGPAVRPEARFTELWGPSGASADPLNFPGYHPPDADEESVRTGVVELRGQRTALIECRFDRLGGTMGTASGQAIVDAFDRARESRLPLAAIVASGGARLQEGMLSLIQMARTVSAVSRYAEAGLLWAAAFTPPTTGGVYASWASLADVRSAQPGAIIGFGGPRVVAEVTGELPPPTSHTAESAYANGLVDALVPGTEVLDWFGAVLGGDPPPLVLPPGRPGQTPASVATAVDAWTSVLQSRAPQRPSGLEWASWLTDGWVELRGTDPSIRVGLAQLAGQRLVVVAMDRHAYGDGSARQGPAAFRLAQRAMRLADRLSIPVLTLIDTPGAEPGPAAEADGAAGEIARTLLAMAELTVPTVALCVGEGGSGGAMALAHADQLLMLSRSIFSVIGPEAGATILFRDAARAPELAAALKVRAPELYGLGLVDAVIEENGADLIRSVRAAVLSAFEQASVGNRNTRTAAATGRALIRV